MHPLLRRQLAALMPALAVSLVGCKLATAQVTPSQATNAQQCGKSEPIKMPPGVDGDRLRLLDEGKPFKVYTNVLMTDDRPDKRGMFPPSMSRSVDLSPSGLTRIFSDVILQSRRFQVYDMKANTTAEHSDVMVDVMILDASQILRPYLEGGRRIAVSEVQVSVKMKNMYTGVDLLQAAVNLTGRTGVLGKNKPEVITAADDMSSPAVQERLARDYKAALSAALSAAGRRIEEQLPPMGRVLSVEGCEVGLFSGSKFGLQSGDDLVVFRAQRAQLGDRQVLSSTRPVALVRCEGVGTETSQCTVVSSVPGYSPKEGDYAVITRESLNRTREE